MMTKADVNEESLHNRFASFSSNSTLHGLRNVGETSISKARRGIWLALVLLMLAVLLYFFINGLTIFLSYPTTTKLNVYENATLVYPAVTICNNNQLRKDYLQNNSLINGFLGSISTIFPHEPTVNTSDPDILEALDQESMAEIYRTGAHQIEEMFTFCTWNFEFFNCTDRFTPVLTERHGLCYTFNVNGSYTTENSGENYGLAVALYLDQFNYDHTATSPGAGLFVHLHSPGSYPLFTSGVTAIPPGVSTDIKINRKQDTLLPLPYEGPGCHSGDSYDNLEDCKFRCRVAYYENSCNCTFLPDLKVTDYKRCTPKDYVVCLYNETVTFISDRSILEKCDCLHHCEEVTYTITQSSLIFPSSYATEYYNRYLGIEFTEELYRSNIVYLKIYYESLMTTVTEQVAAYTFAAFSAEIGGYMGLFLGASLLTISELLEFVGTLFYGLCHRVNEIAVNKDAWAEKSEKSMKAAHRF